MRAPRYRRISLQRAISSVSRGRALCAVVGALILGSAVAHAEADGAEGRDSTGGALQRFVTAERITAWMRLDYFQSSNSLDHEGNLFGATLQVKALPRFSELLDAKIEARFQAPDLRDRAGYDPEA